MAYEVDKVNNSIIFLYKAIPGHCTESFALNVVKVVGL
jgi:DNA mismatch repair ATPase MutS